MAITTSPKPSDGPLSASGPTLTLGINTTNGAVLTAGIRTTKGNYIPIEHTVVNAGTTVVILRLPPGGVPPGSTLILAFDENPGSVSVTKFKLK